MELVQKLGGETNRQTVLWNRVIQQRPRAFQGREWYRTHLHPIPGSGSLGGGHGNPFQYSCLGHPKDKGAWQVTVHRVAKSQRQLKQLSTHALMRDTERTRWWLFSCSVVLFATPRTAASPRVCSNSRPVSRWCPPTISSSVTSFSSCLQSFPTSESFPVSWLFASVGQNIRASASTSVLLMNTQVWFPLWLTGLVSLQSKGFSRVFSSTTVWRHQFFSTQPSLWSNSHIHTWLLEKP